MAVLSLWALLLSNKDRSLEKETLTEFSLPVFYI